MLRRKFLMAVAAAAVAGLLGPASARAAFTFTATVLIDGNLQTFGTPPVLGVNGAGNETLSGGGSFTAANGDTLVLDFLATSNINTNGDAVAAFVFDTTSDIINTGGGTGASHTHTIEIQIAAQPFLLPGQAGTMMTGFNTLTGLNSVPKYNLAYTDPNAVGLDVYARITPDLAVPGTTVRTAAHSYAPDPDSLLAVKTPGISFTRGSQFGITNVISIVLDAGQAQQVTSQAQVTAVPAPATAILALAGAPIFGVFGWMRRRKAVVA